MAMDGADIPLFDTEVVTFTLNTNPNAPVFQQRSYAFRIPESTPPGGYVGNILANDADFTVCVHFGIHQFC